MQNSNTFRRFLYKNSYLWIIAAWLITLSFIIDNYWSGNSSVKSVKKKIQHYIQEQERNFEKTISDTFVLNKLRYNSYDERFLQDQANKKYFLYHYTTDNTDHYQLNFWSSSAIVPTAAIIESSDTSGFVQLSNGFYVWRKQLLASDVFIALIPVKWNYIVTNEYLENSFVPGNNIASQYDLDFKPNSAAVHSLNGKAIFYLVEKKDRIIYEHNIIAVWCRIIAVIFAFLFIHVCATYIALHYRLWWATVFLMIAIVVLRVVTYIFPSLLYFRQFELFDPSVYGSNSVLRSLGDLLINSILFTWIALFIRYYLQEKNITIPAKMKNFRWPVMFFVSGILLVATFVCGQIIRSLVADSQISFDVINFFTLTTYSVVGFMVLCCIAIGYFLLSQVLLHLLRSLFAGNFLSLYLTVVIGGLLYLTVGYDNANTTFKLYMLIWLVVYLLLLSKKYFLVLSNGLSSARLVFWLFFFSISIITIIVVENNSEELRNRKHYAEILSTKADPSSEVLMNTFLTGLRNDFLVNNFNRFKVDSVNKFIKDSLIGSNFSGYINKYDTKIYTFDANEQPLFNSDASSFDQLNALLNTQAKPTGIPDLFYYDEAYDRFSYISQKIVVDTARQPVGYVFILANPKKYKTNALNLELFSKGENNAIENSSVYAFAIYNNLKLVNSHNDYAFPIILSPQQVPVGEDFMYVKNGSFDELWYKSGPQKVVVIAKKDNFLLEAITLFSYLFCAFLLVTTIFWLLNIFIKSRFSKERLKNYWRLSIRNQIHGTIIFISILSFLIIGVATILFFIYRYESTNRERLSRIINVMENEVHVSLSELTIFDDVIKIYDEEYREKLEKIINRISEIHDADVNLYDLEGNLKVSSLPLPYNKGIVSSKMHPVAYYHLNKKKEIQYFKEEKIGKLNFVSNYIPVMDAQGNEYAYLNIPYFTSQSKLKEEIANFLVTIINLNAFIFLIAGIVALFITNRITRSFSFISDKMKAINLGKRNEVIQWEHDDEIGQLVKEYNKMVGKLDESAEVLAKSERESAWREMARQVAHEIKNPLTPMKLSLQYLQKAIKNNSGNIREMTTNMAKTLVEQIDHLTHIAGEFGRFADINNSRNTLFDLNESLKTVIQLYAIGDHLQLKWKPASAAVFINADRTHIHRLFTNLIQNALQAVPEDRIPSVEIEVTQQSASVLVTIKDNGMGIAESMRSKIFTPNFTTKTSGTGLGLAMCKGIVEQAKGSIWFETKVGEGTIFFIEIPVAQQND